MFHIKLIFIISLFSLIACDKEQTKIENSQYLHIIATDFRVETAFADNATDLSDCMIKYYSNQHPSNDELKNKFEIYKAEGKRQSNSPLYDFRDSTSILSKHKSKRIISVITWNAARVNKRDIKYINKKCHDAGFQRVFIIEEGATHSIVISDSYKERWKKFKIDSNQQ